MTLSYDKKPSNNFGEFDNYTNSKSIKKDMKASRNLNKIKGFFK